MMKSLLLEELGRTQTVKDVQTAYNQIFEANRKLAVAKKRIKENRQKERAEIEVFLDDLCQITGLTPKSPMFWKLVALTIDARLRRRNHAEQFQSYLDEGFPQGW